MEVPQGEVHTYAYPGFDTDAFWRGYSESARQFVHVASYLAAPLSALDRLQHAELTGEDEMMIQQALQRIDVIASVVDIWGWLGEDEGLGIAGSRRRC